MTKHVKKLLDNKFVVIVPDYDENGVGQKAAVGLHESLPKSMILDYSRYKKDGVGLDIGELATQDDAETKFSEIVKENVWSMKIMANRQNRSFPIWPDSLTERVILG